MSTVVAKIEDGKIIIRKVRARQTANDVEEIPLQLMEYGKLYTSKIKITNEELLNKIFLLETIEREKKDVEDNAEEIENESDKKQKIQEDVIIVFSENGKIKYSYCNEEKAYKRIIKVKYKVLKLSLTKKKLKLKVLAYIINKYNLNINNEKLYINQVTGKECKLKQTDHKMKKIEMLTTKNIYSFSFNIKDVLEDVSEVNGNIRISLQINEKNIDYRIGIRDKKIKNKRYYYAPIRSKYIDEFALHIRRTPRGNLVLVKRLKEPIENTVKFKIMESRIISTLMYNTSKILKKIIRKKINLFYEKFSSKAEEGAYDLFLLAKKSNNSKNYFVIDKHSEDYEKIKAESNVVKKYSLKYYWLLYNASNFISTEAPIHLNILRSNNKILRKSTCDKKFVFLQHGITYMKCQGDRSTFAKGKEGEANYIIVGSEKEKDVVVDMLKLRESKVIKTGLPIFSKINYNHINNNSDDFITIMLTWKPYEEQLYSFEESTYYQNTIKIFEILNKYIEDKKIMIVPHPKVLELMQNTSLNKSIWTGKISEILEKTKLLITDYSSVCYNSFYQGAGVIFYQEDLEIYEKENGQLIPNADEYIGERVFSLQELEQILSGCIKNKNIDLSNIRTKQREEIYETINEFSDGKNLDRIYEELVKLKLI